MRDINAKNRRRLQNLLDRVDEQEKTVSSESFFYQASWPGSPGEFDGRSLVPLPRRTLKGVSR